LQQCGMAASLQLLPLHSPYTVVKTDPSRRSMRKLALLCLLCLSLGICSAASTGTTDPTLFQDSINWCTNYGCQSQQLGSPQTWASNLGATGMVGLVSSQNMENLVQGSSWGGNFNNGEGIIYNGVATLGNNPGGILLSLDMPVFGVGSFIQANFYGAFTATLSLYDSGFNLLGTYSHAGTSDGNAGTALFIGAYDGIADVSYALFDVTDVNGNEDFAIGTTKLMTQQVTTTPEPASLTLLASSLLGLAGMLRRKEVK
jgi:hypothetical protein